MTFGRVITRFTTSQHTKFQSLLTLDALCKMAAVFWPTSEVAVVKRRLRAPHPPFREEILYSAVSSHGTSVVLTDFFLTIQTFYDCIIQLNKLPH